MIEQNQYRVWILGFRSDEENENAENESRCLQRDVSLNKIINVIRQYDMNIDPYTRYRKSLVVEITPSPLFHPESVPTIDFENCQLISRSAGNIGAGVWFWFL